MSESPQSTGLRPCAKWTPDCQGKQDYDGRLLSISVRYWPGPDGGGGMTFDAATGVIGSAPYGHEPSAHAAIVLNHGEPDEYGYGEEATWREKAFSGPTEAAVKTMVEDWVRGQFNELRRLLGMTT